MKRLRIWVKVVLVIISILLLVGAWNFLKEQEDKARQSCVEGGHTYEWCVRELNR